MLIYKQLFYNYNHVNMHFHLYLTYSQVRWYWAENQRIRAIGMLQAGLAQNIVARHFDIHRNTIQ